MNKSTCINFNLNSFSSNVIASVYIGENKLNEVDCTKFLGLYIDNTLSWDKQIDYVCKKISSGVFLLRQIKGICSIDALKTVYYGVIQSYLSYGIIFWGSCAETKLSRAFILLKSAIRVMCNLKSRESCKECFKKLNIFTLPSLYILETIMFCISKCILIQGHNVHSYSTRSNMTYRQESHRLQKYESLPMLAGVKFLNKLPVEIKSLQLEPALFKTKLKHYLINKAFYSVAEFI